jgi:alpha-1,3-rhamnosyltransferase
MTGGFDTVKPLVSMIIPSYNHEPYVRQCIQGIVDQDYENIELIIIDDGSSDNSVIAIESMAEVCRMRFKRFEFYSRPNKGLCATLNEALTLCRGKYYSVTDSDDILFPHKTSFLVKELEAARDSNVAGVFAGSRLIDSEGQPSLERSPMAQTYDFSDILERRHTIISSSMLMDIEIVRRVGGYLEGLYIEDWYMWLKVTETGATLRVMPEIVLFYRQHETNISRDSEKMFECRKRIISLFDYRPEAKTSLAHVAIMAAADLSWVKKGKAFCHLMEGLRADPAWLRRSYFWKVMAKILMPVPLLDALKRRSRLRLQIDPFDRPGSDTRKPGRNVDDARYGPRGRGRARRGAGSAS